MCNRILLLHYWYFFAATFQRMPQQCKKSGYSSEIPNCITASYKDFSKTCGPLALLWDGQQLWSPCPKFWISFLFAVWDQKPVPFRGFPQVPENSVFQRFAMGSPLQTHFAGSVRVSKFWNGRYISKLWYPYKPCKVNLLWARHVDSRQMFCKHFVCIVLNTVIKCQWLTNVIRCKLDLQ